MYIEVSDKMRTQKVMKNIVIELILYAIVGIVGFFKIRYFIQFIGSDMNGYFQFINNIVAYVFLAEAGLTSGVIYKLYKPLADKDYEQVKASYKGAKKIFRIIGLAITFLSLVALLLLPLLVPAKGEDLIIVLITFVLVISSSLISYFVCSQAYNAIFYADQKKYLGLTVTNLVKIFGDIISIGAIFYFHNMITIGLVMLLSKIIEEFIIYFVGRKNYPWLKDFDRIDTSAGRMSKDLIIHQISTVASNNIAQFILLIFKGPVLVSIYASYNYIYTFISTTIGKINNSISHSFGNMFASDDKNHSCKVFKEYMSFCLFMGLVVSLSFLIGARSFVGLWIGDESYIVSNLVVFLFSANLFTSSMYGVILTAINTNGLFKETKYYAILTACINIIVAVILAKPFGIAGVLIGIIISFFVSSFFRSKVIMKHVFNGIKDLHIFRSHVFHFLIFILLSILFTPLEKVIFELADSMVIWFGLMFLVFIGILIVSYLVCLLVAPDIKKVVRRIKK